MANEKRLIDANELMKAIKSFRWFGVPNTLELMFDYLKIIIRASPTVDAVPVDEIRVDILSICIENQEAILNVSICGKPNEVKIPFSKDVAEVVHGWWVIDEADSGEWENYAAYVEVHCSKCGYEIGIENGQYGWTYGEPFPMNYCPNCGAKMDGD